MKSYRICVTSNGLWLITIFQNDIIYTATNEFALPHKGDICCLLLTITLENYKKIFVEILKKNSVFVNI